MMSILVFCYDDFKFAVLSSRCSILRVKWWITIWICTLFTNDLMPFHIARIEEVLLRLMESVCSIACIDLLWSRYFLRSCLWWSFHIDVLSSFYFPCLIHVGWASLLFMLVVILLSSLLQSETIIVSILSSGYCSTDGTLTCTEAWCLDACSIGINIGRTDSRTRIQLSLCCDDVRCVHVSSTSSSAAQPLFLWRVRMLGVIRSPLCSCHLGWCDTSRDLMSWCMDVLTRLHMSLPLFVILVNVNFHLSSIVWGIIWGKVIAGELIDSVKSIATLEESCWVRSLNSRIVVRVEEDKFLVVCYC